MISKENSTDTTNTVTTPEAEPVSLNAKRALDFQRKQLETPERQAILHHLAECDE